MYLVVLSAAFAMVGAVLCGVAAVAWWRIQSPVTDRFAVAAGVTGVGSLVLAAGHAVGSRTFVLATTIVVGLLLPLPWAVFTFEYIGMERLVTPRAIGVTASPIGIGLVATAIVFGSGPIAGVSLVSATGEAGLLAATVTALQMAQWFTLFYAGGLVLVSTGLLVWLFHRYAHLDSTTGTSLAAFGTLPWLSVLFGLQVDSLSSLALGSTVVVGFAGGAIAAVILVGPVPLLARVPAAGSVGPKTVIEELADLVIVTDAEGHVVEINRTARETLGLPAEDCLGVPIESLLDSSMGELREAETIELSTTDGRAVFEPSISSLTHRHGHLLGYAVIIRDVTDRNIRQQRLEVFNRVLRHNLRNDVNIVTGAADVIRSRTDNANIVESAEQIKRTSLGLTDRSQKVREAEQALDVDRTLQHQTPLVGVVDTVIEAAEAEHGEFLCQRDVPEEIVVETPEEPLQLALAELVENAIEHSDGELPEVRIAATYSPGERYPLSLSVEDEGPGLPPHERRTIESRRETQLQHGTGIGLWIVRWVATSLGGTLAFEASEDDGTTVSISLPAAHTVTEQSESSAVDAENG